MESGAFKNYYRVFEDFFLSTGFVLIVTSLIMKVWGINYDIGLATIYPKSVFAIGFTSIIINIALNVQDIARSNNQ